MKRIILVLVVISIPITLTGPSVALAQNQSHLGQTWPQWRGPLGTGEAPHADPPDQWSETQHIRWKVEIPGNAQATPLVWGNHVFVSTAISVGASDVKDGLFTRLTRRFTRTEGATETLSYVLLALDRRDGRVVWEQVVREEAPHEGKHQTGSWASSSAVTDGEVLCAFFGSRGLYCFTMTGQPLWDHDFGDMEIRMGFGEGASPTLHGNTIVVNWDHQGQSFITALDKRTGHTLWRSDRDEITSWATPLVVEHNGRAQVVTSATNRVRSYDLETGALLWDGEGVTLNAIPSPVAADGVVYLTSGYRGNQLYAVKLDDADGDVTGSNAIVWSLDQDTPYVPSPLLYGGILYLTKGNNGILSAYDARTGQLHYGPERLPGIRSLYASPVAAGRRIYIPSRDGTTLVVAAGPSFEVLSANILDDRFDSSPAIVDGEIYLRGHRYLYCIADD
jgi:outer membrane protein assembly factor BamB